MAGNILYVLKREEQMTKNKIYRSLLLVLIIFSLMVLSVSSALAHHQLKIDLTVNKVGTVIPKEGVATVKGKVTCSQPAYVHWTCVYPRPFLYIFLV
jgi:hypothetical protein